MKESPYKPTADEVRKLDKERVATLLRSYQEKGDLFALFELVELFQPVRSPFIQSIFKDEDEASDDFMTEDEIGRSFDQTLQRCFDKFNPKLYPKADYENGSRWIMGAILSSLLCRVANLRSRKKSHGYKLKKAGTEQKRLETIEIRIDDVKVNPNADGNTSCDSYANKEIAKLGDQPSGFSQTKSLPDLRIPASAQ